jgi:hypothetical protein
VLACWRAGCRSLGPLVRGWAQVVTGFRMFVRVCACVHVCVRACVQVMTGFRIAYGGAQQHFGVTPDVTTMGKVPPPPPRHPAADVHPLVAGEGQERRSMCVRNEAKR